MGKAWDNVIWEHFPQLQPYVVTSTDRKSHYAQGTHDFSTTRSTSPSGRSVASGHTLSTSMSMISSSGSKVPSSVAETSVMRALQTSGRAPYLTKWYILLSILFNCLYAESDVTHFFWTGNIPSLAFLKFEEMNRFVTNQF